MFRCVLALAVLGVALSPASATEAALTPADAKYLDQLIADFLFNPTDAERVIVNGSRDGWLVREDGGKRNRVYFTDGDSGAAPSDMIAVNFVAACRARYAVHPDKENDESLSREQRSAGVNEEADLMLAAWLHKLGHDALAAKALHAARVQAVLHGRVGQMPDPRAHLRATLAEKCVVILLSVYRGRNDEAALVAGTKLLRLYGDVVHNVDWNGYWQAKSIVVDLQRRRNAGTLGKPTPWFEGCQLPTDLKARTAALIASLEDVDYGRERLNRSFTDLLPNDWRVKALVSLGEPALPALLDAFENDNRRTRSLLYPAVRQSILMAIQEIMGVEVVEDLSNAEFMEYPPVVRTR